MGLQAMDLTAIRDALATLRHSAIAVVGDVCLDAYWMIDRSTSEESLETALRTEPVREQRYFAGGGANVAVNLKSLGVGQVSMIGVVGDDPFGDWIQKLLAGAGIETTGVLVQPAGWSTQVFVKPHEHGSELSRIDLGNWNELTDRTRKDLLGHIEAALPHTDLVVINEQALRGIHTSSTFRKNLLEILRSYAPGRAIIDSRHYIDEYSGIMRKLNAREAARILGDPDVPTEYLQVADLQRLAARLFERWQVPLALTAGARGSMAATGRSVIHVEAIRLRGSLDPVGAGDTFLAGLAAGLSARLDFLAALQLGTLAAAVTVRKLHQPGTATSSEILALADEATA